MPRLLLALALLLGALPPVLAAEDAPIALPAYQVNESPLVALGITARIRAGFFSGKVSQLTVTVVKPNSLGAKAGIKPDDEIIRLQGKPILGMKRGEVIALGKVPAGGELVLTIQSKETGASREITLKLPPPRRP